ncbi:MAG TPA: helix-turn-helix transcriptional regulator [Planktothrix sp.]|jgi:transcriptional regulator with XRE-family HTH domain
MLLMTITAAQKFGKIVRQMREERGWTQDDLAAELNADAAYISRIENGKKNASLETVLKLASAFGVKVSFGDKRL